MKPADQEATMLNPIDEEAFAAAMKKVEYLRLAKAEDLARRDRAEWECFYYFACQCSLLRRQAD